MLSKDILSGAECSFGVWALIYGPGYIKIKTAKFFETSTDTDSLVIVQLILFSAGNGLMKKEVEREADFPCSNSNNKSKVNGCRPKNSCCNSRSSKLLPPTSNNSSATLHRSVSSHLLSSARETSSLKSPVSHQSFSSTNNYQNHHQNGPNRKLQNRSKSMANVNTNHVRSNSSMSTNKGLGPSSHLKFLKIRGVQNNFGFGIFYGLNAT